MSREVHVVLASDANYLPGLEVTRATMLKSCSDPSRLVFHVFDETTLKQCAVADMPKWNGSHMPYLRLWLPALLADVDCVIYSDVDTIWGRDVCELWDEVVSDGQPCAPLAWVPDMASMRGEAADWIEKVAAGEGSAFDWGRYGCSGICMMNLRKMREGCFTRRVLDLYAKYGVPKFPDQDVLNVIFNKSGELLPVVWGVMGDWRRLPRLGEKCVYHLTGAGRHFNDTVPPAYPPQYLLWSWVRDSVSGVEKVKRTPFRYRVLALLWPLHVLAVMLPLKLRERIVRQWYFARVLEEHKVSGNLV